MNIPTAARKRMPVRNLHKVNKKITSVFFELKKIILSEENMC